MSRNLLKDVFQVFLKDAFEESNEEEKRLFSKI